MFCVVIVRDVQPEIRPEVTGKMRKSSATDEQLIDTAARKISVSYVVFPVGGDSPQPA
jgi:hypothetical protein